MYPTYENGCMVIVKQIKKLTDIQYGSAFILVTQEQRILKRIFPGSTSDTLKLASDNSELRKDGEAKYPTYEILKEDILKLFIVKGTIKRTET